MLERILISWLKVVCVLTGVAGLIAAAGSYPPTQGPWLLLFDVLSWPLDGQPSAFTKETAAVNAVLGGVMVGWSVLMFAVVTGPIARGDRSMTNTMIVAIVVWFLVDSIGSLAAGLPGNVVLNTSSLLAFVVPLWILRRRG